MRVLFLSPFEWSSAYRGRYYHLFRRLTTRGHSVTVLEPGQPGEPDARAARSQRRAGFARPRRPVDSWGGAAGAIESMAPDVVVVTAPPSIARLSDRAWWAGRPAGRRPLLVFDFSDETYLAKLETGLGPVGFLGRTLGRKSLASLARRADLVTAATETLRRELPTGALLLANPPRPHWGKAAVLDRATAWAGPLRGSRSVRARSLAVAVVGAATGPALPEVVALAAAHHEMALTFCADLPNHDKPALPETPPSIVRFVGPAAEGRLVARLARAGVVVLLADSVSPAEELLAALTAGRPVLAADPLRPVLAPAARMAELTPADLTYFTSFDDLGEKLLRFSLTADPARARSLEAKADRLRWAAVTEAFEQVLLGLLDRGTSGAAER